MQHLKYFITLFFISASAIIYGQDVQFTQLNAVSLQVNPALTGNTITSRATVHYRSQWAGVGNGYNTFLASFDHQGFNSPVGWGVMVMQDQQGAFGPQTTEVHGSLVYAWQLGSRIYARAGLQGGIASRSMDFGNLQFVDQFNNSGLFTDFSNEDFDTDSYLYPDLSAGGILYGEAWWAGVAIHHLIPSRQTFFADALNPLPRRYSVQAGMKIPFLAGRTGADPSMETYIAPMMQYRLQGAFSQLDLGIYAHYAPLTVGVWYRGLPIKQSYQGGIPNQDALAFMGGFTLNSGLSFSYSYDVTISDFTNYRTAGAHEIGLAFQWAKGKKAKRALKGRRSGQKFHFPCPSF